MKVRYLLLLFFVLVASKVQVEKESLRAVVKKLCKVEEEGSNYKSILIGAGIGLAALPGVKVDVSLKLRIVFSSWIRSWRNCSWKFEFIASLSPAITIQ